MFNQNRVLGMDWGGLLPVVRHQSIFYLLRFHAIKLGAHLH